MKNWEDCLGENVYKRKPDKQKAKSLLEITEIRKKDNQRRERTNQNTPLIIETYWEIIKQLLNALLSVNGYKSYSQECLVAYANRYLDLSKYQIKLLEELRKLRNDIDYRGKNLNKDYLDKKRK